VGKKEKKENWINCGGDVGCGEEDEDNICAADIFPLPSFFDE
jgi:hypothetical protein